MHILPSHRPKLSLLCVCIAWVLLVACVSGPQIRDRRVAVLSFESAQDVPRGKAIGEWVKNGLANYPRIGIVETHAVEPFLAGTPKAPNALQEAGRKAGADYLILGSYSKLDKNFIVSARLFAISTGEVVKGSAVSRACDREEDLYPVSQAVARVMAGTLKFLAEQYDAQARAAAGR